MMGSATAWSRIYTVPILSGLLLFFILGTVGLAGASNPLGTVTANEVSCSSVKGSDGVPDGTCYLAAVSCPGVSSLQVAIKVNQPTGMPKGTVLYTVGGGGTPWYDIWFTYGAVAVGNVLEAGYTTVQLSFSPPGSQNSVGWLTGPGGPLALACRWASVAQWVHDNIRHTDTPFCATGNSGGSGAAGYALAFYGMAPEFNFLEQTSGPPFSRIDNGCLCNAPTVQTPCGQGALSTCYGGAAGKFLDPAYGNKDCSKAEKPHHSHDEALFLQDSLNSEAATFSYPTTEIHFVFGGRDNGPSVPHGMLWEGLITPKSPPTIACVPDAPHELATVRDGAELIANDLIANCH